MGVDFYTCCFCHDTFPDCGPYEHCDCGRHWCSAEYDSCAAQEGFRDDSEECNNEDCEDTEHPYGLTCVAGEGSSCNFCRNESATDEEILEYLLEKLSLTREQAEEECLNARD
jgi:hypothetical protein